METSYNEMPNLSNTLSGSQEKLVTVEFKFLAWSSIAQSVCQWAFSLLAIWCLRPWWVRMLLSAEEDNLSPFDSNIACLCQSIDINNNKHVCMYVCMYLCMYTYIYIYIYICIYIYTYICVHIKKYGIFEQFHSLKLNFIQLTSGWYWFRYCRGAE